MLKPFCEGYRSDRIACCWKGNFSVETEEISNFAPTRRCPVDLQPYSSTTFFLLRGLTFDKLLQLRVV